MQITFLGNNSNTQSQTLLEILEAEGYQVYVHQGSKGVGGLIDSFKTVRDSVLASDVVVAHASVVGDSGYELALALEYRRPTILMLPKDSASYDELMGIKHRNLQVMPFRDEKEMKECVLEFVDDVSKSLDAKLFMNIPPSMNKYLDWVATHTRFSKSDVVRNAVEQAADNDKEYQLFLKSLD
jgi:hypothetical protein